MRIILFLFLVINLSFESLPQNKNQEPQPAIDSLSITGGLNLKISVPFKNEFKAFHQEYFFDNSLSLMDVDSNSIWLATETLFNQPGYFGFSGSNSFGDILKPLRLKYENEQELRTIRYVLGMAQLGAVGYLAYRHVKKYGFR